MDQITEKQALQKAIAWFGDRGAQKRFARALGKSDMVISNWLKRRLPAENVLDVERVSGYSVTRHELRPDLYPLDFHCECPGCLTKKQAA